MIVPPAARLRETDFREFVLEFQDFQLAYDAKSNPVKPYKPYAYTLGGGPLPVPILGLDRRGDIPTVQHAIAPPPDGGHDWDAAPPSSAGRSRARLAASSTIAVSRSRSASESAPPRRWCQRPTTRPRPRARLPLDRARRHRDAVSTFSPVPSSTWPPAPLSGTLPGASLSTLYPAASRLRERQCPHPRAGWAHHEGHVVQHSGGEVAGRAARNQLGLPIQSGDVDFRTFRVQLPRPDHEPRPPTLRATTCIRRVPTSTACRWVCGAFFAPTAASPAASPISATTCPTAASTSRRFRSQAFLDPARSPLKVRDYRVVAISAAEAAGWEPEWPGL